MTLKGSNGYVNAQVSYDANNRLVAEQAFKKWSDGSESEPTRYTYDAHGRFVGSTMGDLRLRYDRTGLLVEIVEQIDNGRGPITETTTISYDDQRRPTRVVEGKKAEGPETAFEAGDLDKRELRYDYECARGPK